MSNIVFIQPKSGMDGIGLLMVNEPPFHIGKPYRFESNEAMDNFIRNHRLTGRCAVIDGYNILIAWIGTKGMKFDKPPGDENVPSDIQGELKKMADYYLREKLQRSRSFLQKYERKKPL